MPPHNVSAIIYRSVDNTAENRVETGQTMHTGGFFFYDLRAQCACSDTAAQTWWFPVMPSEEIAR